MLNTSLVYYVLMTEDTDSDTNKNTQTSLTDIPTSQPDPDTNTDTRTQTDKDINTANGEKINVKVDPEERNWELRNVCDSYPTNANFYFDESNTFVTDDIQELRNYVVNETETAWTSFLNESGLHRCAGCNEPLNSLTELYCESCSFDSNDKIPCQNCGETRVKTRDPFCSAACASEYMNNMSGSNIDPLDKPKNPSSDWLTNPFRTEYGIPSSAPIIANNTFVCREDYLYGDDSVHDLAVHVAETHEHGWNGYIQKYKLNTCQVCGEALPTLRPIHSTEELTTMNTDELKQKCDYKHCPETT
jgi:hypothetical protein